MTTDSFQTTALKARARFATATPTAGSSKSFVLPNAVAVMCRSRYEVCVTVSDVGPKPRSQRDGAQGRRLREATTGGKRGNAERSLPANTLKLHPSLLPAARMPARPSKASPKEKSSLTFAFFFCFVNKLYSHEKKSPKRVLDHAQCRIP
ncbi:hypothetical protein EVAR_19797_1 [Eumeta japonica]|uniref:Uncharacterized protein n=1 Tax=Eumeta variegata TaxID=151549 RepID=A0A4C1UQN9_EUMVA|nr:hypothetical protein EVAR_19797_1 [Eumeta japonica]